MLCLRTSGKWLTARAGSHGPDAPTKDRAKYRQLRNGHQRVRSRRCVYRTRDVFRLPLEHTLALLLQSTLCARTVVCHRGCCLAWLGTRTNAREGIAGWFKKSHWFLSFGWDMVAQPSPLSWLFLLILCIRRGVHSGSFALLVRGNHVVRGVARDDCSGHILKFIQQPSRRSFYGRHAFEPGNEPLFATCHQGEDYGQKRLRENETSTR